MRRKPTGLRVLAETRNCMRFWKTDLVYRVMISRRVLAVTLANGSGFSLALKKAGMYSRKKYDIFKALKNKNDQA